MRFVEEILRRQVHRMAAAYLVTAWLIIQVAGTIFPLFGFDAKPARILFIVLAIGFVPAVTVSWVFRLTPEGLRLERRVVAEDAAAAASTRMLDRTIMVVLAVAVAYFAVDKFVFSAAREAAIASAARQAGRGEALSESYGDRSIAVLPFDDLSEARDQEYFSDGISEELMNLLARVPELRVISRTSTFAYKTNRPRLSQIARELNVAHVLEGSVRKAGSRVRITAQLIEAHSDTHLWSQTWDRTLDDVFAVQDEIAAAVVAQLRIKLLREMPPTQRRDPEAHRLLLLGRQYGRQQTKESLDQSVAHLEQAIVIEPGYAEAWEVLSSVYANQAELGLWDWEERFRLARAAALETLALAPDRGWGHARLGWIALKYDSDLAAAARHLSRGSELEPGDVRIVNAGAALAETLGRHEQAIRLARYHLDRDPVSPVSQHNMGHIYLTARRYDEAIASFETALRLSPGRLATRYYIGVAHLLAGRPAAALEAIEAEPSEPHRMIGLPMALHALGRRKESDAALAALIEAWGKDAAYNIAGIHAFRGESDEAFKWLNRELELSGPRGWSDLGVDPLFQSLHADPRWLPMLEAIGASPARLASIRLDIELPAT
jgi:TolB-like protein/Flp pilus assembly protein TadD